MASILPRVPRKVPMLKTVHMKNRLQFANKFINEAGTVWRNILSLDETKVVQFGADRGKSYVRRFPKTEFNIPPKSSTEAYNVYLNNAQLLILLLNLSPTPHVLFIGDFNLGSIIWNNARANKFTLKTIKHGGLRLMLWFIAVCISNKISFRLCTEYC